MIDLSLGELTILEISLISLMKGVDENSDLGKQILELIAKVDAWIAAVRVSFEQDQGVKK